MCIWVSRLKTQGGQYSSPSPRTDVPAHSQTRGASSSATCLFYWGLQMAGQGPPILGRAQYGLCRVHQFSVNFIQKHPQRHSQNHAGPSVWAPQGLFRSHMKSAFTTPASSVEIWLAGCRGPDSIQAWKSTTQNTVCGYKHTNNLCKCTELSESEHRWLITVTFGRVEGRTQNPFFGILGY